MILQSPLPNALLRSICSVCAELVIINVKRAVDSVIGVMSAAVEQLRRSHRPTSKDSTKSNLRRGPFRVACRRGGRGRSLRSTSAATTFCPVIACRWWRRRLQSPLPPYRGMMRRRGGQAETARNWALWFVAH